MHIGRVGSVRSPSMDQASKTNIFNFFDTSKTINFVAYLFNASHQDLKKYKFYYWFAFPALCPETSAVSVSSPISLCDYFTPSQVRIGCV